MGSELPRGPFMKACKEQYSGQVTDTEREACGLHLGLLTCSNLNLCNGNKTALVLSNWLPCIIFVLGSRRQWSLKREISNKSDCCTFLWFRWFQESLPVTDSYLWHTPVTWCEEFPIIPHHGKEMWGPLSFSPVITASPGNSGSSPLGSMEEKLLSTAFTLVSPIRGRVVSLSNDSTWVWHSLVCNSLLCRVSFLNLAVHRWPAFGHSSLTCE